MITSRQLQNMTAEYFSLLCNQCVINQETEIILGKVFQEQYFKKNNILVYNLTNIPEIYHIPIKENLNTKLLVSSIYIQNNLLYIDWSL